ncbi:hypothetical protein [Microbacterium sp. Root166]|uniref:hypothetical protein n=1 Tax=Microbacterium sp. Root166 TaxID=1736478 RepID=UPI0012FB12C1|nr:hypothetical protein [Microbacterium sp. Root166]
MLLDPTDPNYWIVLVASGLLGLIVTLLLIYLVIRLGITHGMLSYTRQLEEERRPAQRYRD